MYNFSFDLVIMIFLGNNVWITDVLKEDSFQQMLNTTYHSNIYTLPIFKTIQNMFKDIQNEVYCELPEDNMIRLEDSELFRFNLKKVKLNSWNYGVEVIGFKKTQNNNEWKETQNTIKLDQLNISYKQLNNQDLALILTNY